MSRINTVRKTIQGLLNKISPDNKDTIVEQLSEVSIENAEELCLMIQLFFRKALSEPLYCELYADIVCSLQNRFPQFPGEPNEPPATFLRALIEVCQSEFEAATNLELSEQEKQRCREDEDFAETYSRKKTQSVTNMRFIGQLYLRGIMSAKVIGQVVLDLLYSDNGDNQETNGKKPTSSGPTEHAIECACTLLNTIGPTLDATHHGTKALVQMASRLTSLQQLSNKDGDDSPSKDLGYSKRICFLIQDFLDMHSSKWTAKLGAKSAKTRSEARDPKYVI